MVLFTGCGQSDEKVVAGTKIYYVNQDYTRLEAESYTTKATEKDALIEEFIVALNKEPKNKDLRLAKPKDISILGYNFGEAGQLLLNFDDKYSSVTGIEEVLMRAAIVKTFTQIDTIKEVEFFINGLPLSFGDVPVGRMEAGTFIDSVGEMTSYTQNATITLYFANAKGDALVESQREVEYDGSNLLEQIIVQQLIDGPTEQETGMKKTIPEGTILNEISVKDRVCSIDFSKEFLETMEGVTPEVTIYSIVNTLVEQTNIDNVEFTINGETVSMYQNISLDQVFERELKLIQGEE
jgi:germination protein M